MRKLLFLPLLVLTLAVCSQTNDKPEKKHFKRGLLSRDSFAVKIQRVKDSLQKTLDDVQWEQNTRNLEDVMRTVEKRKTKDKNKAILYIVIGAGMLVVLAAGLMRRNAGNKKRI
ncbi:MAG: hypothetical protein HOP10_00790 [Chitinophagaceae bacterium]|nr:hypothetical protein [Chitinophagaceae bacterium]